MKKTLLIFICILVTSGSMIGQSFIEDISKAFEQGNASAISKHFQNNLHISFDNSQSVYSKSQAEVILKDFFEAEQVKEYKVNLRSFTKNNEKLYLISTLQTHKSEFLVYLAFIYKNNKYSLTEIQFKRQN